MAVLSVNSDYAKIENGQLIYAEKPLKYNGRTYLNPTAAQYAAAGYLPVVRDTTTEVEEYHFQEEDGKIVIYSNVVTLEMVRNERLADVDNYYHSDAVESFTYGQTDLWIDQLERLSLTAIADASDRAGEASFHCNFEGLQLTFTKATATAICDALWLYVNECNNVADAHRTAIKAMTTKEQMRAYDVTTNYPDKLVF